jgi:hypothetical protein
MKQRGLGFGSAVLATTLLGCGASGGEEPTGSEDAGVVCAACRVAGGETSDFGLIQPPTPCEQSEVAEPLTEAEARELGFGDGLDLFPRTITTSYAWSPVEGSAASASGYASSTDVELTTSVASVEHLVPALAGCEDRLLVHLNAQLAVADGSLAAGGGLRAVLERKARASAYGRIDLTSATGSLRIAPPEWQAATVGYVNVGVYYWPETTRGFTYVELLEADQPPGDTGSVRVIDGRFPVDHCAEAALPVSPAATLAALGGRSVNDVRDELATLLASKQPAAASWSSGAQTQVSATVGAPTQACSGDNNLLYFLPLQVRSTDGRVDIAADAMASVAVEADGKIGSAWFEIYDNEVLSAQEFPAKSGISGVSFRGVPRALWHTEIYAVTDTGESPRGQVTVEGITQDGAFVDGVLDELTWSLE